MFDIPLLFNLVISLIELKNIQEHPTSLQQIFPRK